MAIFFFRIEAGLARRDARQVVNELFEFTAFEVEVLANPPTGHEAAFQQLP